MPITHNKNLNPLLNLLINCICARSVPQILYIKDDCIFLFSNFVITGMCNSSPNSLLDSISFLIALSQDFSSKICKPLKRVHVDIHDILVI